MDMVHEKMSGVNLGLFEDMCRTASPRDSVVSLKAAAREGAKRQGTSVCRMPRGGAPQCDGGGYLRYVEINHDITARPSGANPALTRTAGPARDTETSGWVGLSRRRTAAVGCVSVRTGESCERALNGRNFLQRLA